MMLLRTRSVALSWGGGGGGGSALRSHYWIAGMLSLVLSLVTATVHGHALLLDPAIAISASNPTHHQSPRHRRRRQSSSAANAVTTIMKKTKRSSADAKVFDTTTTTTIMSTADLAQLPQRPRPSLPLPPRGGGASIKPTTDAAAVAVTRPAVVAAAAVTTGPPAGGGATAAWWVDSIKSGLASAMAAACVKLTLQPIDAMKTVQQYHSATTAAAAAASAAATGAVASTSRRSSLSLYGACRQIMQRPGGFFNFYAGVGVTVIGAMPSVGLYFGVYSGCKKLFLSTRYGQQHPTASIAISAAIGNTVASFSRVPYETIKQKLQTHIYTSTGQALREIASSPERWSLLFPRGGIMIQMIRDIPYAVVSLLLYESLQAALVARRQKQQKTEPPLRLWDFVVGGTAGGLASWVTNPMDVVKTRLQTDPTNLYTGSVWVCTKSLWQEGGPAIFLRGSVPRLMHKVPANAFFFLFYEIFRRVLKVEEAVLQHQQQQQQQQQHSPLQKQPPPKYPRAAVLVRR